MNRATKRAALIISAFGFLLAFIAACNIAKADDVLGLPDDFDYKNKIVWIDYSGGGDTTAHKQMAMKLSNSETHLVVCGYCASACASMVELFYKVNKEHRDQGKPFGTLRFEENAVLAYHKLKVFDKDGKHVASAIDSIYRKEIVDYVNNNGGWSDNFVEMPYNDIVKVYGEKRDVKKVNAK